MSDHHLSIVAVVAAALLGLIGSGVAALAVPNHPDRVKAAKIFFSLAGIVSIFAAYFWTVSTTSRLLVRIALDFAGLTVIVIGLRAGFLFANRSSLAELSLPSSAFVPEPLWPQNKRLVALTIIAILAITALLNATRIEPDTVVTWLWPYVLIVPWLPLLYFALGCGLTWLVFRVWYRYRQAKPEKIPERPEPDQELKLADTLRGDDEGLRKLLKSDRESIRQFVKVFIVAWNPEFSPDVLRPYIDFRFAISNISICAVRIEDSIKGYITFLKEGAKQRSGFREAPCLAPNQELYVGPRSPGVLIVRQYVDRQEAGEIETSGSQSQFWMHELDVYFYGDEIDRTQLNTNQVVRKDVRWITDPGIYCGFDDEKSLAIKIENLTAENEWLKSRLDQQPKPTLTFEIDETQSQVHIDSFQSTGRITAKVRLRCEKTVSETRSVKNFHAALLLEHKIGESVAAESVAIEREGAQVITSDPDTGMVKMDNGWKIDEPLTPYRWFLFFLDVPSDLGEPYPEHFLRVTMEAVGQELFSLDFYVQSWRDARQSNSSIRLRKK